MALLFLVAFWFVQPLKNFDFSKNELTSGVPDHSAWTALLETYVDTHGQVDYQRFLKDTIRLQGYLDELRENPPADTWKEGQKLAYWINAYNAFTIELILDYYPITSIKDIGGVIQIPFINSPWDIKFIRIDEQDLTLNDIEHKILRKEFSEPRIHFAIVCASVSCPELRNEAYTTNKLEQQLQEEAVAFINDPRRNDLTGNEPQISKIFQWFKGDFTQKGTLVEFLNKYSKVKIPESAKITYGEYNWDLNGLESMR